MIAALAGRIAAEVTTPPPTEDEVMRVWGWILLGILAFWALLIGGILLYRKLRDRRRNAEYFARVAAGQTELTEAGQVAGDGRRYLRDQDTDQAFHDTYHEQKETHLKLGPST